MKRTSAILALAAVSTAALLHADETVVEKNLYRPAAAANFVEAPGAAPSVQNPPPVAAAKASRQPPGALSGIVVFCSAGHGWTSKDGAWISQRPLLYGVNEDAGNIDQLNLFAQYCFNAGATVVPFRPLGYQTNEVVMDNNDSGTSYAGTWYDSVSSIYFGRSSDVPYRYAFASTNGQTATARFTPDLPEAGFYPVYCWARSGADRMEQLYRISHSGGLTEVRVNHERVGLGWVWLGNYHFEAGTNGHVEISNDALPGREPDSDVVIADAIRFGNGMGDIDRGHGVSGFERELEASRYWIEKSVGQGMSSGIYDLNGYDDQDDNVGAPRRMTEEMNREQAGGFWDRIFLGFHSNAGSGSARGALGLYDTRYPEDIQQRQMAFGQTLAEEINVCMEAGDDGVKFSGDWSDISGELLGGAFGELYGAIGSEMNNTIIEVAFHDNEEDCLLLKNPAARAEIARACYRGTVQHLNANNPSNVPLAMLPESPENLRVYGGGRRGVVVEWDAPLDSAAEGYVVYSSQNGYGFGSGIVVTGEASTSVRFKGLKPDEVRWFRVAAWNRGGESFPSSVARVRSQAAGPESLEVIYMPPREKLHPVRRWFGGGLAGQVTLLRPLDTGLPPAENPMAVADAAPVETEVLLAGGADAAPATPPAPRKCSRADPDCIYLPGQDRCLNYFHAKECKEQSGVL